MQYAKVLYFFYKGSIKWLHIILSKKIVAHDVQQCANYKVQTKINWSISHVTQPKALMEYLFSHMMHKKLHN